MACTTILVGKKASYDGSTMIARNDDSGSGHFTAKKFTVVHPEDLPKVYRSVLSHVEVPLPEGAMRFTAMPNVIDRVRNYVTITRLLEEKGIPGLDYLNYTMDHGALACVSKVIEVIKAENLDPDDPASVNNLQHAIMDSGYISSLDTNQLRDILALCKRYNEELKKDNLVQFADQEPLANKFLDAHPDYLEERYGFEHIVVDEFQDSNDGQLDKIKRLCACPSFKSLMVVGDDAQSIYSFRNTSPDNIIHFFTKMGVSGTELFLTENRRSCEEVTTRDHFHNFVLLHYACHSISQIALFARFAVSVCIITICGTVRNRTNHQDSLLYFVRVSQDLLLYPKIFLLSSTILHVCATCVQKSCVCAQFLAKWLQDLLSPLPKDATILSVCAKFLFCQVSRETSIPFWKSIFLH